MSDTIRDSAVISDGRSGVTLTAAGSPQERGFPTRIDVVAGPFRGAILDETVGSYEQFHRELISLHRTLAGTARLGSHEGFSLELAGNGLGAISVDVEAIGSHVPSIRLEFEFEIDQTYLPAIIAGIERAFLAGAINPASPP